jgi:hypothetical protein
LTNDGNPLVLAIKPRIAAASYPKQSDRQSFLALDPSAALDQHQSLVRSTYGDLRPIIVTTTTAENRTFIYPHNQDQPSEDSVLETFKLTADGFQSTLGSVAGNVYIGRSIAGGVARQLTLSGKGAPDIRFSAECSFLLQLSRGKIVAVETDRPVHVSLPGAEFDLAAYRPRRL